MQEVFAKEGEKAVSLRAWTNCYCNAVETIMNGMHFPGPHVKHERYLQDISPRRPKFELNDYVKAGFTASYEIQENAKEPWNSTVTFRIHAPDNANPDLIEKLKKSLHQNEELFSKRPAPRTTGGAGR